MSAHYKVFIGIVCIFVLSIYGVNRRKTLKYGDFSAFFNLAISSFVTIAPLLLHVTSAKLSQMHGADLYLDESKS